MSQFQNDLNRMITLYEKQQERIDSLEKNIESMVETDTSNQDRIIALEKKWKDHLQCMHGYNTKGLKEQIAELKERNVHYHHWVQSKLDEYDDRILISETNREVLREFISWVEMDTMTETGLLDRLSGDSKTEKKMTILEAKTELRRYGNYLENEIKKCNENEYEEIEKILNTYNENPEVHQLYFSILYEQSFININYDNCNKIASLIVDVLDRLSGDSKTEKKEDFKGKFYYKIGGEE